MRVLVLGATGTAGRAAVPEFVHAGHTVRAHVRSETGAAMMSAMDAEPVVGQLEDDQTLDRLLRGNDAIVDLRVAVPPATRAMLPWAWREYARLRDVEAGRLVTAAIRTDVPHVVHDTVAMVYADGGDTELDEESPVDASGALAANLAAERHLARFTNAGGTGVALRFGQFYGPHDEFSRELMRWARRGWSPVSGHPEAWTSAIHTDDLGSALLVALSAPAGVYNVVDDEPLRRRGLIAILADAAGVPRLRTIPGWLSRMGSAPIRSLARSQRVRAHRMNALGWRPSVPTRREGWPHAFRTALDMSA